MTLVRRLTLFRRTILPQSMTPAWAYDSRAGARPLRRRMAAVPADHLAPAHRLRGLCEIRRDLFHYLSLSRLSFGRGGNTRRGARDGGRESGLPSLQEVPAVWRASAVWCAAALRLPVRPGGSVHSGVSTHVGMLLQSRVLLQSCVLLQSAVVPQRGVPMQSGEQTRCGVAVRSGVPKWRPTVT